ncbi:Pca regulon regulatory protein [Hyphomicrobiales bacterium]|nr:Pca regulon regulatory protein [Hyphomicrobiales bacterium]CAH1691333.1 Pca regulon regulatory protein [Hyphomicrobiales bacterium]
MGAERGIDGSKRDFETSIKLADYVSAFARGLEVIRAFDQETPSLTVSSAAEKTGMSRAAVRRFLLTLHELGYATMDGDTFELRPKVLELGYSYLSTWPTSQLVTPYLREGVRIMSENVSFGVLEGDQAVYIARAEARRLVHSIVIAIGSRVPAVLSAMGRVLLANQSEDAISDILTRNPLPRKTPTSVDDPAELRRILADVRANGWCFVAEEFEQGVLSLAVPVTNADGRVIAAINVGAPTTRISADEMLDRFLPVMRKIGADVSAAISMRG